VKQLSVYNLDLTKLEGKGDFACPRCGNLISSDEDTEEVYSVLEAKVSDGLLEEITLRCNRCGSKIVLTGFSMLGTK
jgi:DNA-directed RNA polymerase subunit RPC12/RpoP